MMIQIICKNCNSETSLRDWYEEDDLKGTPLEGKYHNGKNGILDCPQKILDEYKIQTPADNYTPGDETICPVCGSKNATWF